MEFRILGPLEVDDDGRTLAFRGPKQRALLTILLLNANEVVPRERLIEELWGERRPETAATALHGYVSQLRKVLESDGRDDRLLVTRAPGYELRLDPEQLDLKRFERLAEQGRRALAAGDPQAAATTLGEALSLWRGQPLAEFVSAPFALAESLRLEEVRLSATEDRVEADLALGSHGAVVAELESLLAEHPHRERLWGYLMLALYRSGRQAEALDAYQDARRSLIDELGIEPTRTLRGLQQRILNQDPALELQVGREDVDDSGRVFVGRDGELDELVRSLDDAFGGRGRLWLLVGEPGIGKSRLADELTAHARARGACVLVGRCWEAGGAPAYWPWVQSLRGYLDESEPAVLHRELGTRLADLAPLLPELRQLFPDLPELPELEPESARFRLFDAVASLLKGVAELQPLVLILDDLHAADEPSLLLLQFLTRELADSRLLVVGAYRDIDPSPSGRLTAALTALTREPATRTLVLTGLSVRDVGRFIELTSEEAPSDELVQVIHEETEGNPLFVGEIVRLRAAEGRLDVVDAPRLAIPQSVRATIARRLRHLSDACTRLIVLASVLGREFEVDALDRMAGISEGELLDALDEAMAARVISEVPGIQGRLRFAHVLIRDSLYEALTTPRRVRLHRLAVGALEDLYGEEPGQHLAQFAHHAVAGSDFDKALSYAQRAGDRALGLLAYEEAARQYRTALEAGELIALTDERRCSLLISLGEAEIRAGDSVVAKETFLEAAELAQRLALSRELARAAAGYGGRIVIARAGDDARLVPLLEDGIVALGDQDPELRSRLLARLAGALRDEHSRARRDDLSREAVELARSTGSAEAVAYALDGRAGAIFGPDTVDERLQLSDELHELAEAIGDPERFIGAKVHRFLALSEIGDMSAARTELDEAMSVADELGQPAHLWQVMAYEASLALASGMLVEAEELVEGSFRAGERAQPELAVPVHRLHQTMLREFRGRGLEDVEDGIRHLVEGYPARPVFRCVLAHLLATLGRVEEARVEFDDLARDRFAGLPFDLEWLYAMALLAEVSSRLHDRPASRVLYEGLSPYASFNAVDHPEGFRGSMSRYLGLLASALERWEDAVRHFEDALAMNEHMGLWPWLAHTKEDYGNMLLARGGPGDAELAAQLRDGARSSYRELGLEGPLRRAEDRAS